MNTPGKLIWGKNISNNTKTKFEPTTAYHANDMRRLFVLNLKTVTSKSTNQGCVPQRKHFLVLIFCENTAELISANFYIKENLANRYFCHYHPSILTPEMPKEKVANEQMKKTGAIISLKIYL